jgi:hypothetical protein
VSEFHDRPYLTFLFSEKTIPISRVVNSSRVLSRSDPPLSSDSMLIKWRPVTVTDVGSWENHTVLPGGRLLSWLVSLSSEDIMGFIVEGLCVVCSLFSHFLFVICQIPSPRSISFTSSNTLLPILEDSQLLVLVYRPPFLSTRLSRLEQFATIFLACLIDISIS